MSAAEWRVERPAENAGFDFDDDPERPQIARSVGRRVGVALPEKLQAAGVLTAEHAVRLGRELVHLGGLLIDHADQVVTETDERRDRRWPGAYLVTNAEGRIVEALVSEAADVAEREGDREAAERLRKLLVDGGYVERGVERP